MTEQWRELKETITEMRDNGGTGTQQDVCKFLVNLMEILEKQMQQSCEDCISRKSVDKIINKWLSHPDYELKDNIYDMTKKIHKLPSVTPQQDVGKWIKVDPLGMGDEAYMCSKCKTGDWDITIGEYKFCPYCGQKKEGVEDEDGKSL